jgi:hypothetical protein
VKFVCVLCVDLRKMPSATSSSDLHSACANILPYVPPFANLDAIEYGSATPTRKENEG